MRCSTSLERFPKSVRLFFALWPDEGTRTTIRRRCRGLVRHCGGRPVPSENLHLTLAFLGSVNDEGLARATSAAEQVAAKPFLLPLDRVGYFAPARSLWIGPSQPVPELVRLNQALWTALESRGFNREQKPFMPHVTLARKVNTAPAEEIGVIHWEVSGYALIQSHTETGGAIYQPLDQWS